MNNTTEIILDNVPLVMLVFVLGVVVGFVLGYYMFRKKTFKQSKSSARQALTSIELYTFLIVSGYLLSPLLGLPEPNYFIAVGIFAIGIGGKVGERVADAITQKVKK